MFKLTTALPRRSARLCLSLGLMIVLGAAWPVVDSGFADAKAPGHTYCFYKTCHRVKTLAETRDMIGKEHTLPASFYDDCKADRYNPCGLTSSGEVFRPNAPDNAASSIYPDGTKLLVWSPQSGQALVLRINNAGPYWGNRTLDVSRAAAEKLGFKSRGVANLKASILEAPTKAEATYRKGRHYAPVAGDIGHYQSASAAQAATMAMQMVASAALAPFNGHQLPASLVTDDVLPSSTVAVAALAAGPRISKEAVEDAASLASLKWPVVYDAAVAEAVADAPAASKKVASLDLDDTDEVTDGRQGKRTQSWSQRATKARLKEAALEKSGSTLTVKPGSVRKAEPAKPASRAVSKTPVPRRNDSVSKAVLVAAKGSNSDGNRAVPRAKPVGVAAMKTPKIPLKALRERDAPNDISVFSRYNPDAPKSKQAANKPGLLKTSAIRVAAADRS